MFPRFHVELVRRKYVLHDVCCVLLQYDTYPMGHETREPQIGMVCIRVQAITRPRT